VFSPYYHFARQFGPADPVNHCAVNVVLYEPDGKVWCMTERKASAVQRSAHALTIGNSSLFWDGTTLTIEVEELSVPLPKRVKGVIRVRPRMLTEFSAALDRAGHHRWGPIAPVADIEVDLRQPALRWSGSGYLDSNDGDQPLEAAFRGWHWSRTERQDDATIFYDVTERDGTEGSLALHFAHDGSATPIEAPPEQPLPPTAWRLRRATRATPASIDTTLEDGPFYARTRLSDGTGGHTMHETLSMDRFTQPWVRAMLPFRMPRALR
jgi:carotenoid 1,2-hydratase